jgi:quercetin dioxygenase-like cupin family protein
VDSSHPEWVEASREKPTVATAGIGPGSHVHPAGAECEVTAAPSSGGRARERDWREFRPRERRRPKLPGGSPRPRRAELNDPAATRATHSAPPGPFEPARRSLTSRAARSSGDEEIAMRTVSLIIAVALLTAAPAARAADAKKKATAAKPQPVSVNPDDIKWGEAPPQLPKGAQLAVLHGDPSKKGTFTLRLKMPDGYRIPPHWHTRDEQLTVVSGTFLLRMGDTMDAPPHELGEGAYHYLPGKMHHAAEANGETVVQVHGMGPFDIHYLNPADDPSKTAGVIKK